MAAIVTKKKKEMTVSDDVMAKILKTIRAIESGGDYKIKNKHSSASGAYQFLDTTWGNYGGYKRAMDAPPAVQDEKARINVLAIIKRHGTDYKWVPAAWYAGGAGSRNLNWDTVLPGNRSSINQYVNKWMAYFQKLMSQPTPPGTVA